MTLDELRVLCMAAGFTVPEEDLPALREAFANHLVAVEAVRAIDVTDVSGEFDPRWT